VQAASAYLTHLSGSWLRAALQGSVSRHSFAANSSVITRFADYSRQAARWEHFPHEADVGVRGVGMDVAAAFEQAALAMTAVITEPQHVVPETLVELACQAPDTELLLYDWLNALVYEMATRHMLFSKFSVDIDGAHLRARAWGERIDRDRHQPRVEVKGATLTELRVEQGSDGLWRAQCVLDV
jgi:tRNA nucleotidyltransferase (CCA-adding enzyme)